MSASADVAPGYDIDGFAAAIGDVPAVRDPDRLRQRSRDRFTISPVLRKALRGRLADIIVEPQSEADLARIAAAAARLRIPVTARGGGTANYGQSVPLQGGVLVDCTALTGVEWSRPGLARIRAGTLMAEADRVLQADGFELRIHPSTRATATLAGFVAGGSGGIGACQWGMLREPGNIAAIELITLEEEPRTIRLAGADVALVHHAYGTNGLITHLEMPTAPAWRWHEIVTAFDDYAHAIAFAVRLTREPGLVKKLASVQEAPAPSLMPPLKNVFPEGPTMASFMIAELCEKAFLDLLAEAGGTVVLQAEEGASQLGIPTYECAFGHGLWQIQKSEPRATGIQGLFSGARIVPGIAELRRRLPVEMPMRFEAFRSGGEVVAMGSPLILYDTDEAIATVTEALQAAGAHVANSHATSLRGVGIKEVSARDMAFKHEADPHGLMNPGKFDLDAAEGIDTSVGGRFDTSGWAVRTTHASAEIPA